MIEKFLSKLIKGNVNESKNHFQFEIIVRNPDINIVRKKEILENGEIVFHEVEERSQTSYSLEKLLETLSKPIYKPRYDSVSFQSMSNGISYTEKYFSMDTLEAILYSLFFDEVNWNDDLENYLFSHPNYLSLLADGLVFLSIYGGSHYPIYFKEHIIRIFKYLIESDLDKPEYLDIVEFQQLGCYKYGGITNFKDYKNLRDLISIALDYAENYDNLTNVKEIEKKLSGFESLFSVEGVFGIDGEAFHTFCKSDKDKINLFKSLVLLENKTGHLGRYAYSLRLFSAIRSYKLDSPELLDWTFKNRHPKNDYIPFGEFDATPNIRNYQEYKENYLDK